jgi:predicted TIM-barrel fold metal-dependent hydrolase
MGMFLARDRPSQPSFLRLIGLLKRKIGFVKLTGAYRMSQAPGFADAAPMARALIEAAPDRLIWGSDYPHLSFADKVTSEGLFELFKQWAGEEAKRILVDNPAKLFNF